MAFIFYDTETTGLDVATDQILQIAAIKTDDDLVELDRFNLRCRLLPTVVPSPYALWITGTTPQMLVDRSLISHYELMSQVVKRFEAWGPATFVGYNSIAFDEKILAHNFYRNLLEPSFTSRGGNSSLDAFHVMLAASICAHDAINIAYREDGGRTFKLDRLAPANGFDHRHAHDALADVEATLHLCRRLKAFAPAAWDELKRPRTRENVLQLLKTETVCSHLEPSFGRLLSSATTHLGLARNSAGSMAYVFDLSFDPAEFLGLDDHDLSQKLFDYRYCPVMQLRLDQQPILFRQNLSTLSSDSQLLAARADTLRANEDLRARICAAVDERLADWTPQSLDDAPHFSEGDAKVVSLFHEADWLQRGSLVESISNDGLRELGRQLIYLEQVSKAADPLLSGQTLTTSADAADAGRTLAARPGRSLSEALNELEVMSLDTYPVPSDWIELVSRFLKLTAEGGSP